MLYHIAIGNTDVDSEVIDLNNNNAHCNDCVINGDNYSKA